MQSLARFTYPLTLVVALLAMPLCASAQSTDDPNPGQIFERCVHKVRHDTRVCINTMEHETVHCIRVIRELLENGHVERAHHVARRCIRHLEAHSSQCKEEIARTCHRCIHVLRELGAEELANRLARICEESLEQIERATRRFIRAIQDEFDG